MKRTKIIIAILLLAASVCMAAYGLTKWRCAVVDEFGDPVTITSFAINTANSTAATVYSDEYKTAFTNPATSGSTVSWYANATSFDIVATDGTRTILKPAQAKSDKRILIPGYIDLYTATHVTGSTAVTAADSGQVFISDGNDTTAANVVFTLPSAYAGLSYTFIDANATAADDLWVTAAAGDKINGGTAAKSFKNTGDVYGAAVTVIAVDATNWIAIPGAIGTWANDNN